MVALYGGALFTLVSAPPGTVTPEVAQGVGGGYRAVVGGLNRPPRSSATYVGPVLGGSARRSAAAGSPRSAPAGCPSRRGRRPRCRCRAGRPRPAAGARRRGGAARTGPAPACRPPRPAPGRARSQRRHQRTVAGQRSARAGQRAVGVGRDPERAAPHRHRGLGQLLPADLRPVPLHDRDRLSSALATGRRPRRGPPRAARGADDQYPGARREPLGEHARPPRRPR